MRHALGLLIILWGLSMFFSDSFAAADQAGAAAFGLVQTAADSVTGALDTESL